MIMVASVMLVMGFKWRFSTPFGLLFLSVFGIFTGNTCLLCIVYSKKIFKWDVFVEVLPLLAVSVLLLTFLLLFSFYFAAFTLWPLIKIGLNAVISRLIRAENNVDATPFLVFLLNGVSALSANFLFVGASEISSVMTMVAIVVIENLVLARSGLLTLLRRVRTWCCRRRRCFTDNSCARWRCG